MTNASERTCTRIELLPESYSPVIGVGGAEGKGAPSQDQAQHESDCAVRFSCHRMRSTRRAHYRGTIVVSFFDAPGAVATNRSALKTI